MAKVEDKEEVVVVVEERNKQEPPPPPSRMRVKHFAFENIKVSAPLVFK